MILNIKNKAVDYIKKKNFTKPFQISFKTEIGLDTGYRYLIKYYQLNPTQNDKDPLIEIVVPADETLPTFGNISVKIPPELAK